MKLSTLSRLLPFFAAGSLSHEERKEIEKELPGPEGLETELNFWRQVRRAIRSGVAHTAQGHPTPDEIIDYTEGKCKEEVVANLDRHFRECADCQRELSIIKETYPKAEAAVHAEAPRLFELFHQFLRPPRLSYALPIAAFLVVCAITTIWYLSSRQEARLQELKSSGALYLRDGKYADAELSYERALALADHTAATKDDEVIAILDSLALTKHRMKKFDEAESLYKRALALRRSGFESGGQDAARIMQHLADLYRDQGNNALADALLNQAEAIEIPFTDLSDLDANRLPSPRRNIAITLVPQSLFRGAAGKNGIPRLRMLRDVSTVTMSVVFEPSQLATRRYSLSLTWPSKVVVQLPDTLVVGSSTQRTDTAQVVLDKDLLGNQVGRFRLRLKEVPFGESAAATQPEEYLYVFVVSR